MAGLDLSCGRLWYTRFNLQILTWAKYEVLSEPIIQLEWLTPKSRIWKSRHRGDVKRLPFWGSKRMSIIMPISREWYREIQEVLYSSFMFLIYYEMIAEMPPSVFCLSFLPDTSFTHSIN